MRNGRRDCRHRSGNHIAAGRRSGCRVRRVRRVVRGARDLDHGAAETTVARIEHAALARRDRALRALEAHVEAAVAPQADAGRLVGLAIPQLHMAGRTRRPAPRPASGPAP